ncbi:MAG: tetratricopeptide repeat protein [Cyclobacteriaceae bacterium]
MKSILFLLFTIFASFTFSQTNSPVLEVTVKSLTDTLDGAVGEIDRDIMGNLFVADFGEKVWKISPWGDVSVFSNTMYGASGNTLDVQGNLYQAQYYGNTIVKINRYTKEVTEFAHKGLNGPVGLTFIGSDLYVCNCNNNTISKIDEAGIVKEFSKSQLFNCPNGITVGQGGNLFVVNYRNPNIVQIDTAGNATLFVKLPASSGGHIIANKGNYYVTSFFDHKIFKVSYSGTITHFAGTGQPGVKNGKALEAQFAFPNGIVAGPGKLFVNDKLNDPNGGPIRSVIREINFPDLTVVLNQALTNGGIEELKKSYKTFKTHELFKGDKTEVEVNLFGYRMLSQNRTDVAIALFELNTESYPESFNTWDSLAEAYMISGDKQKAKAHYQKSLKLNPQNQNAKDKIKELAQ